MSPLARLLSACRLVPAICLMCAAPPAQERPAPLGKGATESLVARYEESDHWVQQAVVVLSLNEWWHPAASAMLVDAMTSRDPRLRAFGLEALLRSDDELLPMVATPALLDELVKHGLTAKNDLYRERSEAALRKLLPDVDVEGKREWSRWWLENEQDFVPRPWQPREQPKDGAGGTSAAASRAFDLYQSGLDLMLVIDSTGSMQPTIDALAAALGEMVDILGGLSPKLRLGVVHYKDYGELGKEGAKVVQPFTKNIKTVRKKLDKLRAYGGGDLPEAVLGGLGLALSKKLKWQEDANKIAIVIGDAPPHDADLEALLALVRGAREDPVAQLEGDRPTTGAKAPGKSFLTSAIGVFLKFGPDVKVGPGLGEFKRSQGVMRDNFRALAKAGGGVFVEIEFVINDATPPTSKERREAKKQGGGVASEATRRIVEHILVLTFGEKHAREMREFVRIFFEYKRAGLIK